MYSRIRVTSIRHLLLLGFLAARVAWGAEPVLYQKLECGSVVSYNPLSLYLNTAFDTAQIPSSFSQEKFFSRHGKLFNRLKSPAARIEEEGGWGRFFREEFFGVPSIPNWTLHIVGGGYDCRYLSEWYAERGLPTPYLLAFLTTYLADVGNEALETSAANVRATDHIADLFFFDPVGKVLFLNDDVAGFFQNQLQMRAWPLQPMVNVNDWRIQNAGANWIFRPKWFGDVWRPFLHMGVLVLAGASHRITPSDSLSLGVGMVPTDPRKFKGDVVAGLYWDRDDSLLTSLTINGTSDLAFRVNVYPGVVRFQNWHIGVFAGYSKTSQALLGLNVSLPVGVSASF